jgi:hypothetical protein
MRPFFLSIAIAGCGGRSHDDLQTCDPCGDSDSDVDGDTDADTDTGTGTGTGTGTEPRDALRPLQVCGFEEVSAGATTLRFMTEGCLRGAVACTVAETDDGIDLRPTYTADPDDDAEDCSPAPAWYECAIPDGASFGRVTVWGELLAWVHHESDMEVDHPDCVQLAPERVPDDCGAARPLEPRRACAPEAVRSNDLDGLVTATNTCECVGDFRDAGCEVREALDGSLELTPLVSQCGGCGPEAMCQEVRASCHLYDLDPGSWETTIAGGAPGLSFTVLSQIDRWDAEIICVESTD